MLKSVVLAAVLGISLSAAAASAMPMEAVGPPAADKAILTVRPGAMVKDAAGGFIGTVREVGKTDSGLIAVVILIDGRPVTVAAKVLAVSGDAVISSLTKVQIQSASGGAGG
jgi:hypothetical protein